MTGSFWMRCRCGACFRLPGGSRVLFWYLRRFRPTSLKALTARPLYKVWSSTVLPTATLYGSSSSGKMSNSNEVSDITAFYRMYQQWESENKRSGGPQPQHHTIQDQRTTPQRLSPTRLRLQPSRQTPLRNAPEITIFFRAFDEIKKRLDEIYSALNNFQNL